MRIVQEKMSHQEFITEYPEIQFLNAVNSATTLLIKENRVIGFITGDEMVRTTNKHTPMLWNFYKENLLDKLKKLL